LSSCEREARRCASLSAFAARVRSASSCEREVYRFLCASALAARSSAFFAIEFKERHLALDTLSAARLRSCCSCEPDTRRSVRCVLRLLRPALMAAVEDNGGGCSGGCGGSCGGDGAVGCGSSGITNAVRNGGGGDGRLCDEDAAAAGPPGTPILLGLLCTFCAVTAGTDDTERPAPGK
jgi:hypothetical protein